MLVKQAQVLVGKSFVRADIAFGETITAIGTLPDPAELDGTGLLCGARVRGHPHSWGHGVRFFRRTAAGYADGWRTIMRPAA